MKLDPINYLLDRITMYRLVVWVLRIIVGGAIVLSFFGFLPYSPVAILVSAAFLVSVCWLSNKVFSMLFKASTNAESYNITALILCLIITPSLTPNNLLFMASAGALAMASKYILAINRKHIFNPAAIAVVITYFAMNQGASWWVGDLPLIPFTLILGFLVIKKIQRFDLIISFVLAATTAVLLFDFQNNIDPLTNLEVLFLHSPLLFFASIMLTEPFSTPPTRILRVIYGGLIGLMFYPQINIGNYFMTPEIALVIGNIFAYAVSPKHTLVLKLLEKTKVSPDILDFSFPKPTNFSFLPGQYMEWTLPHQNDTRGNRRYFSIASSPTEETINLGVKFIDNGSSFKKKLTELEKGEKITAGQLRGDFLLPDDKTKKLVFISGGIGITPFRSMIKYLLDTNITHRESDITLIYSNKFASDIVYKSIFDEAEKKIGLKTIYTLTDEKNLPKDWKGSVGRVSAEMIKEIPSYKEAIYYLSGPHSLVKGFENALEELGIPRRQIKIDFFPGYV